MSGFVNAFLRRFNKDEVQNAIPKGKQGEAILASYPLYAYEFLKAEYGAHAFDIATAKSGGVSVRFERNADKPELAALGLHNIANLIVEREASLGRVDVEPVEHCALFPETIFLVEFIGFSYLNDSHTNGKNQSKSQKDNYDFPFQIPFITIHKHSFSK